MTGNHNASDGKLVQSKRQVRLTIKSRQSGYGQEDHSEVTTFGEYFKKRDIHYIFYKEYTEDGMEIKNRLTVSSGQTELRKRGNGHSALVFRQGHSEKCVYCTPVGPMELVSDTKKVDFHLREDSFLLVLDYSFFMSGNHMSDYHLTVNGKFL